MAAAPTLAQTVAVGSIEYVVQVLNVELPFAIFLHCGVLIDAPDPRAGRPVGITSAQEQPQSSLGAVAVLGNVDNKLLQDWVIGEKICLKAL